MRSPSPPRTARSVTTAPVSRLSTLVLGTTAGQRFALTMWLISFVSYLLYGAVLGLSVALGYADGTAAAVLVAVSTAGNGVFYAVIRSGLTAGRTRSETVGVAQLVLGMLAMWVTYALVGPVAPAYTVIMGSHIMYAGFSLPARSVRALSALGLTGLAGAMLIGHELRPGDYPVGVQAVTFLVTCIVLPLTARLARAVIALQDLLRTRSEELQAALTQVEGLATTDELTGIDNRRQVSELLRDRLDRSRVDGGPLCVAMIDLDRFKAVNDRYGHAEGDEVLRRFATAVAGQLRPDDLFGRWGGEEFLIALPGLTLEGSGAVLARLAAAVAGVDLGGIDPDLRITFSAGLVEAEPADSIHTVVERADRAMYRAKSAGRDRVETGGATTPASPTRPTAGTPDRVAQPSPPPVRAARSAADAPDRVAQPSAVMDRPRTR